MDNCIESRKVLSVIIVAYKNLKVVKECLESIFKWNDIGDALEVVVVDNSPNKEYLYNYLKEKYEKKILLIKNENKGFGQGNNVGVSFSSGKYLLFLNSDTILVEPIFKYSISKFENESSLAVFGVKLLKKDLSGNISFNIIDKIGMIYILLNKILNKMNIFLSKKMFISAADMFIRKDIFIEVGMFDENIFMYCEERDLTKRIFMKNKKYKIKFSKEKHIIHIGAQSSELSNELLKIQENSLNYYYEKFGLDKNEQLRKRLNLLNKRIIFNKFMNKEKYIRLKQRKDYIVNYIEN